MVQQLIILVIMQIGCYPELVVARVARNRKNCQKLVAMFVATNQIDLY